MSQELADFEKQVCDFIKEREEVLISSIPARMRGAIPTLKKVGTNRNIQETNGSVGFQEKKVC